MPAFLYSLLLTTFSLAVPVEVQNLDGSTVQGQLNGLSQQSVLLETKDGPSEVALVATQRITFQNKPSELEGRVWLELVDGSELVASRFEVTGNQAMIHLTDGNRLRLDARQLRAARFKTQNQEQRRQWQAILHGKAKSDLMVIRKEARIDYLEGVLGDVNSETIKFQLDDETIPVRLAKVEGIVYLAARANGFPPAILHVSDIYGSQLEVREWNPTENDIELKLASGIRLRRTVKELRHIDFSTAKIVFLGDVEPARVDWRPFLPVTSMMAALREFYGPRRNRAMGSGLLEGDDGKLRLWVHRDGRASTVSYDKGLSLHSRTSVTYQLPEDVKVFRALAGIDARVRDHGHVRLVITGDGRELFAEEIAGSSPPQDIALDIRGISVLEILVDYGENQDIGDHLNLCNARLVK